MAELSLRRRLADRYEAEAERAASEFEYADALEARDRGWFPRHGDTATPAGRLTLPSYMPQPKPAHLAIMGAVDALLTMGLTHPNAVAAPAPMRTMIRMLRRYEPLILEELVKYPEAECIGYMRTLATAITHLADSVDPGANHANGAAGPDQPRSDQPSGE